MDESNEKAATPAAYLPFRTFQSAIESLEHGLPKKLDRTMWRSQSGIVQGQIMAALRFLCLIDDSDEPTPALQRLVAPENRERRPEQIGALLRHAYRAVLDHDLTRMTPKMLEDLLSQYSVQGETKRKAMAFFLRAAKYAELPMHPLLSAQIRNTATGPRKRKKKISLGVEPNGTTETPFVNLGQEDRKTKFVKLSTGTTVMLTINANWLDMRAAERDYVFGLVDKLQAIPPTLRGSEERED